jgi:DNA mismatch endonuclease (patch repair protein)
MADESPTPLNENVRLALSKMPRRDTKPEMALRRELHRRGLRFRVGLRPLPGTPDIAFTRAKLAVFVDGCFWHGCSEHYTAPRNNAAWWATKLATNQARDRRVDEELVELGWLPLHIWEHEQAGAAADTIEALWADRIQA